MRILVIEDEHKIANSIKKGLEQESYAVDVTYNGEQGFDLAATEDYDVIILDLMLPKKNGFDVLIDVKRNKNTQTIPVIILSNLGQESDIKRALSLGAEDYLIKTEVSLSEVVDRVREKVAKSR